MLVLAFVCDSYVAFYFSFLYMRYRAGIVTKEMLGIPKKLFVAIGFLEALGVAAGMAAGGTEFKCSLGNNMHFVGV